jgi:ribosomal protein S27E
MRLYVECRDCHNHVYLNIIVESREALSRHLGSTFFNLACPFCTHTFSYHVNEVYAESSPSGVPAGAVVGGVLGGLIGGPLWLLIGGLLGASAGGGSDATERQRVENFNGGGYNGNK